jgi:hypothetical protein
MHKKYAKLIQHKFELPDQSLPMLEELILNMGTKYYRIGYYDSSDIYLTQEEGKELVQDKTGEDFDD